MQFTQWDNSSLNLLQEDIQDNLKIKAQWARLPSSILLPNRIEAECSLKVIAGHMGSKIWGAGKRNWLTEGHFWLSGSADIWFNDWEWPQFQNRRSSRSLEVTRDHTRAQFIVLTWKGVISSKLHHFLFFFCKSVFSTYF